MMSENNLNILHRRAKGGKSKKPPIVFVHGAWNGAWNWQRHFLEYFSERGFDVYAPDLRGHGDSPAQKAMRWNRISDYTDDVLSVVNNLDNKPILVGHSMGGFVAQHCMVRSDKLAAVALLASVPHYGVVATTANIALRRPMDFIKINLMWTLYPLVQDPIKAQHMFLESNISQEEVLEFGALLDDESYLGFLDMLFLDLPKLPTNLPPVTVIAGEKDMLFSVGSQQSLAKRYGAECHVVDGAPHSLMLSSQWRETAGRLEGWIDTL